MRRRFLMLVLLVLGVVPVATTAGVQVQGTRVIYPAGQREVTVNVNNVGATPRLLQVWVDNGDPKATAETASAPFLVVPGVARVEPGKGQALRVLFTGSEMPQDRESVFWLNVLEVPPKPQGDAGVPVKDYVQFAVRTRIKLFYRPGTLSGDPVRALDQVSWRLLQDGAGHVLECNNASPYNFSLNSVRLKGQPAPEKTPGRGGMCPAKGQHRFAVDGSASPTGGALVYEAINDYGALVEREALYSP